VSAKRRSSKPNSGTISVPPSSISSKAGTVCLVFRPPTFVSILLIFWVSRIAGSTVTSCFFLTEGRERVMPAEISDSVATFFLSQRDASSNRCLWSSDLFRYDVGKNRLDAVEAYALDGLCVCRRRD